MYPLTTPAYASKDAKARSREGAGVGGAGRSRPDALNSSRVEDLVGEYLEGRPSLHILTAKAMGQAVQQFVHKDEKDYIKE